MSVKRITINRTQKVWQARTCLCHVSRFGSPPSPFSPPSRARRVAGC